MKIVDKFNTIKYFGFRSISQAVWHRLAKKCGLMKRKFPAVPWSQQNLSDYLEAGQNTIDFFSVSVFFPPLENAGQKQCLQVTDFNVETVFQKADQVCDGSFSYFSKEQVVRTHPLNWHENPLNQALWPADVHWCELGYFSRERSDIKLVWEINRFSWAYDLVRAYGLSRDEKYAECFWGLFDSWMDSNQPNLGVNWVSGQECALRLMACFFAVFAFQESPAATPERMERFLVFCAVHAERIEHFISHAIRQKTNHAVTEAAGLYTVGMLCPFFKKSEIWKSLGKRVLESEGSKQIYDDGSYVQQSMNYHRLMLQAYLWSLRLAELNGDDFSGNLKERLNKAADFLFQMHETTTGRVPNYGANDGALILPLNDCDYLDYRPIIQSMNYVLNRKRLLPEGKWDEDLLWLFGPEALESEKETRRPESSRWDTGGYYTLRTDSSWGMIRCHSYKDRVGHVDMLHLDLWADGDNLLRDCGSYRYFAPDESEMEKYFKSVWAHNTAIIDDQSPLKQVSRFMLVPWPKAQCLEFNCQSDQCIWEGEHDAYMREPWNVIHSRHVKAFPDEWKITDTFKGKGRHQVDLRWHCLPSAKVLSHTQNECMLSLNDRWFLKVESSSNLKCDLLEAQACGGWESLYYNHKSPIKTLSIKTENELPVKFVTIVWKGTL
jgi:hypothetical protein